MATEKPRAMITLDEELFEQIEDFRFKNRYPNRSMAINALLEAGIQALKDKEDTTPKKPTRKKRSKKQ